MIPGWTDIENPQPLVLIERAELARQRGQQDVRERHLEDARKLFIARGATRVAEALART